MYVGSLIKIQQSLSTPNSSSPRFSSLSIVTATTTTWEAVATASLQRHPSTDGVHTTSFEFPLGRTDDAPDGNVRQDTDEVIREYCHRFRDIGLRDELRASAQTFCASTSGSDEGATLTSSYVVYGSRDAGMRAAVATNLWIDLQNAEVFHPIQRVADDGGSHDPRFLHASVDVRCLCAAPQDDRHGVPPVWHELWVKYPSTNYSFCRSTTLDVEGREREQAQGPHCCCCC
ncbi:hypothetical protein PINS_up005658 [Pythium insidiosum]|nr:hypothetical protein PINS_up005658 [Pythium insidiosum]